MAKNSIHVSGKKEMHCQERLKKLENL